MTDPAADVQYLSADQSDRQFALAQAGQLFASGTWMARADGNPAEVLLEYASAAYRWLRNRDSLKAAEVRIVPGVPRPEGTPEVATVIDLSDVDQVTFTLAASDAKGAVAVMPEDTWSWVLTDPDQTGSVLTVSEDTLSATVAAGSPDTTGSLLLTVTGATSGLTGSEGITVVASAATAISLVAGTPSAEPAPAV